MFFIRFLGCDVVCECACTVGLETVLTKIISCKRAFMRCIKVCHKKLQVFIEVGFLK